jgi:hypothetical protein
VADEDDFDELDGFDDEGFDDEPLDEHETAMIQQDLTDLADFEATFRPEGYRGVAVWCPDCVEEHYYPWDMLRENLQLLLDTGETPVHEPAFAPEPDRYIQWDYARGYVDALRDAGVAERVDLRACGRVRARAGPADAAGQLLPPVRQRPARRTAAEGPRRRGHRRGVDHDGAAADRPARRPPARPRASRPTTRPTTDDPGLAWDRGPSEAVRGGGRARPRRSGPGSRGRAPATS